MMSTITNVYAREHPAGARAAGGWNPASDADVGVLLMHCFRRAVGNPCARTMDALHTATDSLARAQRTTALAPENAVVMLKRVLRGQGGVGWAPSLMADRGPLSSRPESLIYAKVFRWWVSAYYDDRPSTSAAAFPPLPGR